MQLWLIADGEDVSMAGGRKALAAALLCVLAATGCTAEAGTGPVPAPSSPVSPTETAQERQERLDYAAAEKAYRTFRAEYNRVLRAGGAKKPTKVMKATAGGEYLQEFSQIVQAYSGLNSHRSGVERIGYVRHGGWSPREVRLDVCEDGRSTVIIDSSGKRTGRGEVRTASLNVKKTGTGWKLWSGKGKKVRSCL